MGRSIQFTRKGLKILVINAKKGIFVVYTPSNHFLKGPRSMKKLMILFLVSTSVQAAPINIDHISLVNLSDFGKISAMTFGITREQWSYKETYNGNQLMKESGPLYGVKGSLQIINGERWFLAPSLSYKMGTSKYEGALMNGTPLEMDSHNAILDGEVLLGKFIPIGSSSHYRSYLGLQYHSLTNKEDQNNPYDYDRFISQYSLLVGLGFMSQTSSNLIWSMDITYFQLLQGIVKTELSDATPLLPNIVNQQNKGKGGQFTFSLSVPYNQQQNRIGVEGSYLYRHIEDSEPQYVSVPMENRSVSFSFEEPENTTQSYALTFFLQF